MRASRKNDLLLFIVFFLGFLSIPALATTYYVDVNSTNPVPPYADWSNASTDIQSAVDLTTTGDVVMVNNGVYQSGGYKAPDGTLTCVVVTNAITLESANGAATTFINGSNAMRCVYLDNGTVLNSFTLTNGSAGNGAGVCCRSTNAIIMNCIIVGNTALSGAGAYSGTLTNSLLSGNQCPPTGGSGGGAMNSLLNNCILIGNVTGVILHSGATDGGGANECVLNNCTISGNAAYGAGAAGGGVCSCTLNHCIVSGNYSDFLGGGENGSTLNSCVVTGNTATKGGGGCGGVLNNCTISGFNIAAGGATGDGTYYSTANNCIIYYNATPNNTGSTLNYCCTPDAGNIGCITNAPLFVNLDANNFELQSDSPCIDAGNDAYVTTPMDITGGPRILGANVDMGAYEYQPPNYIGIELQPIGQTVPSGQTLSFNVSAVSPLTMNYQWQFDGTNIAGATNTSYSISNVQSNNDGAYNVIVSNGLVRVTSSNATLNVIYPVQILTQPSNQVLLASNTATFTVTAAGTALNYQWYFDGTPLADGGSIAGSMSPVLSIANAQANNNGSYTVGITNLFSSSLSSNAGLTVYNPAQITVQPASEGVPPGKDVIFTVTATGTAIGYQWFFDGIALTNGAQISGSASPALIISDLQSNNYGNYTVAVTNILSVMTSQPAYLEAPNIRYVNANNTTPIPPYTSWAGAAPNIQDAVNISTNGDLILVTNGAYQSEGYAAPDGTPTCVIISNTITLQSINGPRWTSINGSNSMRCAYLDNGAVMIGFTLTNGAVSGDGGGAYCTSTNEVFSNCVITANSSQNAGAGVYQGSLTACVFNYNSGYYGGATYNSIINNSLLISNQSFYGGAALGGLLNNCVIESNTAEEWAGGVEDATLNDCLIAGNSSGNLAGGELSCILNNCTLVDNSAATGGGAAQGTLNNCIVYYNSASSEPNFSTEGIPRIVLNNCCSTPLPPGTGNITNAPLFASITNDFHLQSNSLCINTANNAYVTTATDLDGNPRIVGGTVDIGCYEYQTPTSVISYAYLQQYGLPTDGSVDFTDFDDTGFNVYEDWIAGLNPTNPASVLAMLPPTLTNNPSGVTVSWQSVSGILYNVQRSTNLSAQPPFLTIQSNITGQAATTSYIDTTATNNYLYLYRVGVP